MAVILKGILLNVGYLFIDTGVGQVCWVAALVALYSMVAASFRPWRHIALNTVDIWGHQCLGLACCALMWFARTGLEDVEKLDNELSGYIISLLTLIWAVSIPAVAYTIYTQKSAGAIKK